jgi:steroid 5-alpha reductase family enzyme
MNYWTPLLPFVVVWLLMYQVPAMAALLLTNGLLQLLLFLLLAVFPAWRNERMSYVDLAWPWGLVLLGLLTWLMGDGYGPRVALIGLVVLITGLRMGLLAYHLWQRGWFNREFPRYRYQRRRWRRAGKHNTRLAMVVEVLLQGMANATFLALPALVMAINPDPQLRLLEWVGLLLWLLAIGMESLADYQKQQFLRQAARQGQPQLVCDHGLWAYSRHPNYFAEWMVWNALIIMALPSWFSGLSSQHLLLWLLIGVALLGVSWLMYSTLVYVTGARPAEFYSLKKRPGYAAYQRRTNRFFPGPRKS